MIPVVQAKSYWQHCGEIISSRQAVCILQYLQSDLLRGTLDFCWWTAPSLGDENQPDTVLDQLSAYCGQVVALCDKGHVLCDDILPTVPIMDPTVKISPSRVLQYNSHRAEIIARIGALVQEAPRAIPRDGSTESSDLCSNIALTPCGMNAIYTALRLALLSHQQLIQAAAEKEEGESGLIGTPPPKVVVFGFPYLDTLKVEFIICCNYL